MKNLFVLLFLLTAVNVSAAPPSRVNTYVSGTEILASDVTQNEDAIFNYLQSGVDTYADDSLINADIKSTANIQSDKLNLTSIAQDVAMNGNVTIGNASGDTLTIDSGAWTLTNAVTITGTIADLGTVTTTDINGGTMDDVQIAGATTTGTIFYNDASDDVAGLVPSVSGLALISNGTTSIPSYGVPQNIQLFTSSGTFTAPVGITKVYLSMVGGGSSAKGGGNGGGGAGGGWILNYAFTVVSGNSYTVTVGAGGAAVGGANNGIAGGSTSFDSVTVAGGAAVTGSTGGVAGGGVLDASGTTAGVFVRKGGDGGTSNGAGGATPFGNGADSTGGVAGSSQDAGDNTGAGGGNGNGGGGGAGGSGICIVMY